MANKQSQNQNQNWNPKAKDSNCKPNGGRKPNNGSMRGRQGRKDSNSKRVNYDNAREDKVEEKLEEGMKKKSGNPPAWHFRNPELMNAASSLPFASILGDYIFYENDAPTSVPGVMTIGFNHAFGGGKRPIAINQASDSNYSFIVHANSRDTNATAPDYTILTVAGMDAYCMLASIIRAYGTAKSNLYNEQNLYRPDILLKAQGFDPVDVRQNLGKMWFDINNFIDQMRQIWIPNIYPLLERWYWLNSGIYKDAEGERAQTYMFVQNHYMTYSEVLAKTGSALVEFYLNGSAFTPGLRGITYTWEQWRTAMQTMIDNLISVEDRGLIYGNILMAYGPERIYELQPISSDYAVTVDYNAEVLSMLENITIVSDYCRQTGLIQVEEDLYPTYRSNSSTPGSSPLGIGKAAILNFHVQGQPSNEIIVEATRMMNMGLAMRQVYASINPTGAEGQEPATITQPVPDVICAEQVTDVAVYYYSTGADGGRTITRESVPLQYQTGATAAPAVAHLAAFDWHPFVYVADFTWAKADKIGTQYAYPKNAYGDYDNYIVLQAEELRKMHEADMYSLWGVPIMLTKSKS